MANLGNISLTTLADYSANAGGGFFTRTKQPTFVEIHIDDAPEGAVIILTTRGGRVDFTRGTSTGAYFYGMDDGDYLAYVMFDGSPGLAWSINVTGTTVTITRISTSGITPSFNYA